MKYYYLDDNKNVCSTESIDDPTLQKWFNPKNCRIKLDTVNGKTISTVFLMIDHSHGGGAPVVFETMVFPDNDGNVDYGSDLYQERCHTYEQALVMHQNAVNRALNPENQS